MAQLTIYLPDSVEARARKAAKASKKSVSRWVAERVINSVDDTWPSAVLEAAGSMPDFPSLKKLRQGYGKDARRESLK